MSTHDFGFVRLGWIFFYPFSPTHVLLKVGWWNKPLKKLVLAQIDDSESPDLTGFLWLGPARPQEEVSIGAPEVLLAPSGALVVIMVYYI